MRSCSLLFFFCLLLFGCVITSSDRANLNVSHYNTEVKNYHSVLIVYSGTSVDRVIFDNVANELMNKFQKLNVVVYNRFVTDAAIISAKNLTGLAKEVGAEAVFSIVPMKTARVAEYYSYHPGFETRKAKAGQIASLELYDVKDFQKPVWGARFNIYVTVDHNRSYKKMASRIIASLQQNAVWQNRIAVK